MLYVQLDPGRLFQQLNIIKCAYLNDKFLCWQGSNCVNRTPAFFTKGQSILETLIDVLERFRLQLSTFQAEGCERNSEIQ